MDPWIFPLMVQYGLIYKVTSVEFHIALFFLGMANASLKKSGNYVIPGQLLNKS